MTLESTVTFDSLVCSGHSDGRYTLTFDKVMQTAFILNMFLHFEDSTSEQPGRREVVGMKCSSKARSSDFPRWKITNSQHGHDWL